MSESTWDDPKITAYVLGELPDEERGEFESRLESDGDLAAAVEEARSVTGQLQELYAAEPTQPLDAARRDAITAGEPSARVAQDRSRSAHSWKVPVLLLATAAALLLLIGVPPMIRQQEMDTVGQLGESQTGQVDNLSTGATERGHLSETVAELKKEMLAAEVPAIAESLDRTIQDREFTARFSDLGDQRGADDSGIASQGQNQPGQANNLGLLPSRRMRAKSLRDSPVAAPTVAEGRLAQRDEAASAPAPVGVMNPEASALELDASTLGFHDQPRHDRETLGNKPVEFLPESGRVVVGGGLRDLDRANPMKKEIEEIERVEMRIAGGAEIKRQLPAETEKSIDAFKGRRVKNEEESKDIAGKQAESRYFIPAPAAANPVTGTALGRGGMNVEAGGGLPRTADFSAPDPEGVGPGKAGDRFELITDNPFKRVAEHPESTFSIDVDTASYSKTRDFLMRANQLPRPDAVRIEEFLNYFDYEYDPPSDADKHPFAAHATVTACPWNEKHRLARIALKGKIMKKDDRPQCNLVFLLDTSGSMNAPNKLPLVIEGMQMLLNQLDKNDRVAITVYAGSAGLVLDSTPAKKKKRIRNALTQLGAGGSTNGGAGIALAYRTARDNFITEGVNRVILCTDGDFNVGTTGTDQLVRMVEQEAKGGIFLSVLGFGMGNHNDAMLEQISGRGNGNYAFIDNRAEAQKVLVNQTNSTLVTIAKDVKLQIEFNPKHVSSYRLIGYENRVLAREDFNNDKIDAGEIGAGHAVTALYEIVPPGVEEDASQPKVDDLKFQTERQLTEAADSDVMLRLKLRYKQPDGDTSTRVEFTVRDDGGEFKDADHDFQFAAAVASFGMQLRRSDYAGTWTMSDVLRVAVDSKGEDVDGLRAEFVEMIQKAKQLMGQ